MVLLIPLALAADPAWPRLELSATSRDFGLVPIGSTAVDAVTVTNGGDLPMGLRVELAAQPSADFRFTWDTAACDSGTPLLPGAERQADTGESGWDLPGSEGEVEPGADAVLPAGCSVTIDLAYSPSQGGAALGALVLTSSGDYPHGRTDFQTELPAYAEDPVEVRRVVTLEGRTDGEAPDTSGFALLAVDASPNVCREGESVKLNAWIVDPDGGTLSLDWGTDAELGSSLLDDPFGMDPTLTCPPVETECGSQEVGVSVLGQDADGHMGWASTGVWVIDENRETSDVFVAGRDTCRRPADPCGCAHAESGLPLALAAAVFGARRRDARRHGHPSAQAHTVSAFSAARPSS